MKQLIGLWSAALLVLTAYATGLVSVIGASYSYFYSYEGVHYPVIADDGRFFFKMAKCENGKETTAVFDDSGRHYPNGAASEHVSRPLTAYLFQSDPDWQRYGFRWRDQQPNRNFRPDETVRWLYLVDENVFARYERGRETGRLGRNGFSDSSPVESFDTPIMSYFVPEAVIDRTGIYRYSFTPPKMTALFSAPPGCSGVVEVHPTSSGPIERRNMFFVFHNDTLFITSTDTPIILTQVPGFETGGWISFAADCDTIMRSDYDESIDFVDSQGRHLSGPFFPDTVCRDTTLHFSRKEFVIPCGLFPVPVGAWLVSVISPLLWDNEPFTRQQITFMLSGIYWPILTWLIAMHLAGGMIGALATRNHKAWVAAGIVIGVPVLVLLPLFGPRRSRAKCPRCRKRRSTSERCEHCGAD